MEEQKHYYPPKSAGRLMVRNVPIIDEEAIIGDIEKMLRTETKRLETINYIYVVNNDGVLCGVLSVKMIFTVPKTKSVKSVMISDLVTVRTRTDQERVARLALTHNIKAIPVVDDGGHFLGAVPSDVILQILQEESVQDILLHAGIMGEENPSQLILRSSSATYFKRRFPWLLIGMLGGMLAAVVVGFFEHLLAEAIALASFIPAVVYMADAVGGQTQTVFIRGLTTDTRFQVGAFFRKELWVSTGLAIVLGLLAALFAAFFWQSILLGVVVGCSFFLTIITASLSAVGLPLLFNAFKLDPAIASGPFATVIRDLVSILIYFLVVSIVFFLLP